MNKLGLAVLTGLLALVALAPGQANARVFVGVGVGGYYRPHYAYAYPPYYPYYGPPVVYAPPPVVYAPPPAVVTYAAPPVVAADQTSPTFLDSEGRTCRQFQATSAGGPPVGTACMMTDGSWRVVP